MAYRKNDDGSFTVTSKSGGVKEWIVSQTITSCDCPKFKYILRGQSPCHHMIEVEEGENKKPIQVFSVPDKVKPFIVKEYYTPLSMNDFIKEYGVKQLDFFLNQYVIVEVRGLIRVL